MGRGREPWERSEAGGVDDCSEWGGAESRGSGARPVELMIMSNTCATHTVSSPTEELRKDKRRSDDSGRRERTSPGFSVCFVCGSCPWGAGALLLCLFMLLSLLNVRRFPPPSSRSTNCVHSKSNLKVGKRFLVANVDIWNHQNKRHYPKRV